MDFNEGDGRCRSGGNYGSGGSGGRCTGDLWVVGGARVVGWWEFSERLGEARTCEPHGQFVGIMGSASCKDGLIKNFAKGVAVKLLKPLAKFSNNERKNLF